MKDIDDLIELIMGDSKLKESLGDKVYRDEPILRRASQLVRDVIPKKDGTPAKLMEMRRMVYTPEAQWKSREWLFYKQGRFMEDFEDSFEENVFFNKYFPVYSDMTLEQQRSFFSWRTAVRRGEYRETSISYIFLYAYELINLIGVPDPRTAYDRLRALLDNYGEKEPNLKAYLNNWLFDMVIYYGLDISLADLTEICEFDKAVMTLRSAPAHSRDEIFEALNSLSSYNAERSSFYKAYPEDLRAVAVDSYLALSDYYNTHRKNPLFDKYIGKRVWNVHRMFHAAVFCHYRTVKHDSVVIDEVRRYVFRSGDWYCEEYVGKIRGNKNIGDLLRAVDSIMRKKYDFKKPLRQPDIIKPLIKIIEEKVNALQEEKKRAEAARIDIDLSKLGSIRRAADITREKLIVDEGPEEMIPADIPETQPETAENSPSEKTVSANTTPLTDGEYAFMQALLYGGDCSAAARNAGSMPSLLADSINEKLYDDFADTVIEFNGEQPLIIEDYEEELKGMILP
ncbi:MAG: TerB N-terminal domain-containing protein [Ruminococcus sp.]|nr:TerB N-terminal domain-containing protein [Ruminococcus sp.]